uniref:Bbp19-like phage domain-containing protein n=1 Tax=viral metagenome TaxID=1070528 RepID=A0A6M3XLM2_9ZZZZ
MGLTDIRYVKDLQSNLRATFDTPQGKEVMRFLEVSCGWYESIFDPVNRDMILLNAGKREVLATIKTLLEQPAETIVAIAKEKENA